MNITLTTHNFSLSRNTGFNMKLFTKDWVHIYANVVPSRDKYIILLIFFSTIANGLVPAITSILTGRLFDLLTNIKSLEIPKSTFNELTRRSMSIMALGAACLPIMWISISSWMWLGEIQGARLRRKLLHSYISKPIEWFDKNDKLLGDFVQLNRCIEEVRSSSAEASAITFQNMVAIISLIAVSFYYSWSLTLIILCSTPIIVMFAIKFSWLINKYTKLENEESSNAADKVNFVMSSAQLVKMYGTQEEESYKFMGLTQLCNAYFIKSCLYVSANTAILRFLTLCMFVQGFWFGASMVRKGKLNIADVITCFHSCLMLGSTLSNTLHQIVLLQKGDVAIKKLEKNLKSNDVLDENKKTSEETTYNLIRNSNLVFNEVDFTYPSRPHDQILNNLTLKLETGKVTFIVGRSGSGKSTISNILLKLYDIDGGGIFIGDQNIKDIDQNALLQNITIVEQRCTLFNDTIRNNILFGSSEFDDMSNNNQLNGLLDSAIKFSLLSEFIDSLPDGLETQIGSEGISLSGGQQQRVALARAYMRDTSVLILDEAVCALDISHRMKLMHSIREWRDTKTTIVLSHNLDDIESTDYVYVMENGSVVQHGPQHELMDDKAGTFYLMSEIQNQYRKSEGRKTESGFSDDSFIPTDSEKFNSIKNTPALDISVQSSKQTLFSNVYEIEQYNKEIVDSGTEKLNDEEAQNENVVIPLKIIIFQMVKTIRNKKLLFCGVIFSLLAGATNPIFSYTFSYLLNGIVPGAQNDKHYLLKWSFVVMGVSVADGIFNFLKSFILGYCSEYWIMDIRNDAIQSILHKSIYWFSMEKNKPSEISALLMNDLRDLRSLVSEFLSAMSTFLIVSFFGLIWALVSGWKLSLVCLSMFPLIIIISSLYGGSLQKYETNYKSSVAKLENGQYEVINGIKTIKCLKLQNHFNNIQENNQQNMRRIAIGRAITTGMGIATTNTLTMCIQAILYYYGLKLVFNGEYSSKKMFETFTLLLFTIMTCTSLISQIPDIARGQRAATWIERILKEGQDWNDAMVTNGRHTKIGNISTNNLVKIENLDFSYPSAPAVKIFSNLNLQMRVNTSIAIVGESGAGKSTLALLLTKLYDVNDKTIFIDDTDINRWDTSSLRSHITMVEQMPVLIDGTLRKNLLYGNQNIHVCDRELYDVMEFVGISDILDSLTDGLDSRISTTIVSGGQAQRLCLARAILRKPTILILDESTSALDAKSAAKIRNIVQNGLPGTLIISITHSKSMMQSCSHIIVLKNGSVIEQGSYNDLNILGSEFFRITSDS